MDPRKKFHFLCGDDEAAIERLKYKIVETHLTPDQREENYREIIPTGNPPTLKRVMGDLLSELSTVSFLPDIGRVVTLYTVSDFFEARAAKPRASKKAAAAEPAKSYSEHLAHFISKQLPQLSAVLIVIAVEDYEKWKRVASANPVVELAVNTGCFWQFKEDSPQFAFFDALFARQAEKSVQLWREWLRRAPGSPKPYMQLATQLRLLIQAKTATSGQLAARGVTRPQYEKDFMPREAEKNLFALKPEFRREKLLKASTNFSFQELLSAYERLMPLQKYAIPQLSDPYVPDKPLLAELWILELAGGASR